MKLLILLLTLCNGLIIKVINQSQQERVDCVMVLLESKALSVEVPRVCKNMFPICASSIHGLIWSKECHKEIFELVKPENDRESKGEESITTTVSEWTLDTTFMTSVITGTVSTKVPDFMERKYTSFYTYFRY